MKILMRLFGRRKQFESEMDAEMRFHMETYVDDLIRSGVDRTEAERLARIEFGSLEASKEECRESWGLQRMDELRANLRLTFRMLGKNPGFAAIAILSLALGIGANTAIFGLVDAVMLRMLPVREPERLVLIQTVGTEGRNGFPPYPFFEAVRDKATSFESVAAFSATAMELIIDDGRESARGIFVSGNFYNLLGVQPLIGRSLTAADDQTVGKGGPDGPVAVISYSYWQARFAGDPRVLGRVIRESARTVTIVGVMPNEVMSIEPGRPIDIALPMMLSDPTTLRDRGAWWLDAVARLKPGVSAEQARTETNTLFQAFMGDVPPSWFRKTAFDHIELDPAARGMDQLRKQFASPLTALVILAGLVLLAACVNVANLMLARATVREKEFAVRLAIGAGRGRLIRQTLTEAMVLVGAGSALGIALAIRGQAALAAYFAEGNKQIILNLSLNPRILLFTLGISVLTGLAFGSFPALRAARVDPGGGLQSGSRSVTRNRPALRVGRALMILQVALSTVLLAGAGLFIRSLRQLESVDLGFAREGILTMEIAPERQLSGTPEWLATQTQILERIQALPTVRAAGWSTMSPLSGRDRGVRLYTSQFVPKSPRDNDVHMLSVSPDYFATYDIRVLLGRAFSVRDEKDAPKVVILNETASRFYFGDQSPIGKRVNFKRDTNDPGFEVIGVVKDVKQDSVRKQAWRIVYLAIPQSTDRINRLALAVRTSGSALALAQPVQAAVRKAGPSLLITNVSTIEKQVELSLMKERLVSTLSLAFGSLALVLACIGLYGILSYSVARRTHEIGIRMALGATRGKMVNLVVREALALAIAGIVIGIPASLALGQLTQTLLYGVKPFDLPAIASTTFLLILFAALAAIVPARRAIRLDPMSALRSE